jgi:hypothetical protein
MGGAEGGSGAQRTVIVPGRTVKDRPESEGRSGCCGCAKWTWVGMRHADGHETTETSV